ncbi:MAG: T9SS type A sorting domain-containing protein, partial [Calditrichaeota bacterium]|nr:T9SS type A sorting domain-containing protein [Calditrichota bacterium]
VHLALVTFCLAPLAAQQFDPAVFGTDGAVYALTQRGTTLYIGGEFSRVSPTTAHSAIFDLSNNHKVNASAARPDFRVQCVAPDGNGGWFIGGWFRRVAGDSALYLARLNHDGSLDSSWQVFTNGFVYALAVSGDTLYVGGGFNEVAGQSRVGFAAVAISSQQLLPIDLPIGGSSPQILDIIVMDNDLLIGGSFTTIGGQIHNRLAMANRFSGVVSSGFAPVLGGAILDMDLKGDTLFVAGQFGQVNGNPNPFVAAFRIPDDQALPWNPFSGGSGSEVNVIVHHGDVVYAGGDYSQFGSVPRNNLAAIDANTGAVLPWDPDAESEVNSLAVHNGKLYAGGFFEAMGTTPRWHLAEFDLSTGDLTSWEPWGDEAVLCLYGEGDQLYAGGRFKKFGGEARSNIAAIDLNTGEVTPWAPESNDIVRTLLAVGDLVYAGGDFSRIGGQNRGRLAALDLQGNADPGFVFNANNDVLTLATAGDRLYAGGIFTSMNGATRFALAGIDLSANTLLSWGLNISTPRVESVKVVGNQLFFGGDFLTVNGESRRRVASIDRESGALSSLSLNIDGGVEDLIVDGDSLYLGGQLFTVNGENRSGVALYHLGTGTLEALNPDIQGAVRVLALNNGILYVGGNFSLVNGMDNSGLISFDVQSGQFGPFQPNISQSGSADIRDMVLDQGRVYAGGVFLNEIDYQPQFYLGAFIDTSLVLGIDPREATAIRNFELFQNYPNPFNPATTITFRLEKAAQVALTVYDLQGRAVSSLQSGFFPAGSHQLRWEGVNDFGMQVASGVYFYQLRTPAGTLTRKMLLIR